jgi:hypothetical protein
MLRAGLILLIAAIAAPTTIPPSQGLQSEQQADRRHHPEGHSGSARTIRAPTVSPPRATVAPARELPTPDHQYADEKPRQSLWENALDWLANFFTELNFADVAIAAFTGMLWWSTRRLWGETKLLREGAESQAEKIAEQIAAAKETADAVKKSAAAAEATVTNTRKELRAYVTMGEANVYNFVDAALVPPGKRQRADIEFKNVGKTPARNVVGRFGVHFGDRDLTEMPAFEEVRTEPSKSSLGSNVSRWRTEDRFNILSDADLNEIRQLRKAFYAYGIITYDDVFGERHTTKYQFYIGGVAGMPNKYMSVCPTGNEED